jgi:SAM-dependent methyltransferase
LKNILKAVEELYTDNLEKFGTTSKAVGWNTIECQHLRFEKLVQFICKEQKITINDLGCGYGAFFQFLTEKGFLVDKFYGYDISVPMLKTAKEIIGNDSRVELINSPLLTNKADYSCVSGIFNVKCDADELSWLNFILQTLDNLDAYSEKGFSFNLLTKYVDFRRDDLYYANPGYFFDLCKTKYSKKVNLVHDYNLWEWTITVDKN